MDRVWLEICHRAPGPVYKNGHRILYDKFNPLQTGHVYSRHNKLRGLQGTAIVHGGGSFKVNT